MTAVLLDTCAAIWLGNGAWMRPAAMEAIETAAADGRVFVSPATGLEIGMLSRGRGRRPGLAFLPDVQGWLADLLALPGMREASLDLRMATAASALPGDLHNDPMDRLIVATALALGMPVVTRDRAILGYAAGGYVRAIE